MKKTLKSVIALVFCFILITATATVAFAALGNVTNLKATNVTYNSATLTWTKASGAYGYQIRPYTGGKYGTTVTVNSKTTSYKATLTPGASYYFYVRSYDRTWTLKGYKYTYGAYAKVAVKAVPAQVTGLTAVQSGTSVKLTWTKVPSITGYVVQQYKGGKYTNLKVLSSAYNTYTATGCAYGSTQYFRVVAYAKSGTKNIYGAYSAVAKIQLKTAAPTTIKVKGVTATSGTLYWSGASGATGYQVYDYATKKAINAGAKKELTISGLKAGTKYNFRVRSYVKYGSTYVYSAYSTVLYTFTTAPAAITGVTVSDLTDSTMNVSWKAGANCLGYQVYVQPNGSGSWTRVAVTAKTTAAVTGLKANTKYGLAVRGYVKNDSTYYYGAWSTFQYPVTKMAAPTVSYTATENQLNLKWNKVSGAANYILEKYNVSKYEWEEVATTTATTYTDTTSALTGKLYRVTAVNAKGEKSVIAKGTTVVPTPLSSSKATLSATLTWGDSENNKDGKGFKEMASYEIYAMKTVRDGNSAYASWYPHASVATKDLDSYTFSLVPGCVNSYLVYAKPADGSASFKIAEASFDAADFAIDNSDAGKNAQILYFVNAVNKSKFEQGDVTVKCTTNAAMNLEYVQIVGDIKGEDKDPVKEAALKLILGGDGIITADEFKSLMKLIGEDADDIDVNSKEVYEETYTFTDGVAKKADGGTVKLKKFIEPSATSDGYAYLYNQDNATAWKNGFSSVAMAQYSDGRYKFTAVLKQEKFGTSVGVESSLYHPGLVSTIEEDTLSTSKTSVNELSTVGDTKIVAVINIDGSLDSLAISSPFTTKIFEDMDILSMGMKMNGTTATSYTFTRGK